MQLKGRQIPLGKTEAEAWVKYSEIMAGKDSPTINEVFGKFLTWCQRNREHSTYEFYRVHLQPFQQYIGPYKTVKQLRPWNVTKWLEMKPDASANYQHNIIRAIKRALNWATRQGLCEPSQVAKMASPTPTPRDRVISQDEFDTIMSHIKDGFREYLTVLWATGARPKEIRIAEARHFYDDSPEAGRLVFERVESKGKRRRRVVHLTGESLEIVRKQADKYTTGPLFRSRNGEGWTKSAVSQRFQRLSKKTGIKCTSYVLRHAWATRQLRAGKLTDTQVARLMGHTSTRMLAVYEHLSDDDLRGAMGLVI
jgi:integrase